MRARRICLQHVDRLAALISTAPEAEKRGLLRALAASGGSPSDVHSNRDHETANRGQRKGHRVVPVAPVATAAPTPTPSEPTAAPTPSPDPTQQPGGGQGGQGEPSPPGQHGGGGGGQKDGQSGNGQGQRPGVLASRAFSSTTENGVEANLYPVPARGAG